MKRRRHWMPQRQLTMKSLREIRQSTHASQHEETCRKKEPQNDIRDHEKESPRSWKDLKTEQKFNYGTSKVNQEKTRAKKAQKEINDYMFYSNHHKNFRQWLQMTTWLRSKFLSCSFSSQSSQ